MTDTPLGDRWQSMLAAGRPWTPPARRTVVVAPHPDDESLSSGGLVAYQRERGLEVIVIAVSDGEASYDPDGDGELARTRRAEQRSALELLGVGPRFVRRLGLPDSRVADFEVDLSRRLIEVLRPDDLLVATWSRDVHPDHEACGRAALEAVRVVPAVLVFSMFWTWHHRVLDDVDASRLLAFELSDSVRAAKQEAIRQHTSQFETQDGRAPILDDVLVEPATWSCEYFLDASLAPTAKSPE